MKSNIIKFFNAENFAKRNFKLEGTVFIKNLDERVLDCLINDDGIVSLSLESKILNLNTILLEGKIKFSVNLECQSSLEDFTFNVEKDVFLVVVQNDKQLEYLDDFYKNYEPYISDNFDINVYELIEEEIILSLPMIPKKP